jgi:hypothetical protein
LHPSDGVAGWIARRRSSISDSKREATTCYIGGALQIKLGVTNMSFFSGIVSEFEKLINSFNHSTFGQGLAASGAAVVSEVGTIGGQELTTIITSGTAAAVAAAATGGSEAIVLSAAAAAIKTQSTGVGVQLTTAALTTLAAHVTTSIIAAQAAQAAPASGAASTTQNAATPVTK